MWMGCRTRLLVRAPLVTKESFKLHIFVSTLLFYTSLPALNILVAFMLIKEIIPLP